MKAALKLIGTGALGLCVAFALVPWKLRGATKYAEIAKHISEATGLSARIGGDITLKLLPRPRVQISGVSVRDSNDAVLADAPTLYGDLDIPSLLKGKWQLISATLADPTVTVDIDKLPGPASPGDGVTEGGVDPFDAFKLSFRSGVIRVRSQHSAFDTLITDVDATAQLSPSADGSLALSGRAVWHSAPGQFTGRLARPRAVLNGGTSPASLQATSAIGSFSAAGDLSGGAQRQFAGRVTISSNAVPRLFAAFGLPAPWIDVQRAMLSGDAMAKLGDVSLSSSTLRLDDTTLEGTLGFHADGKRGLIEGTLATDFLDLGRFAGHNARPSSRASLFETPVATDLLPMNIDLRVSASVVRWGQIEVQDSALSAFSHDGRVEVTLDEASAFNGIVKAHATASVGTAGIEAHADLSVAKVDLGPLTAALAGEERATGALTGKVAVEGRGRSLSDMVHGLSGTGQANVDGGNFMGLSVTQALKRFARKLPLGEGQAAQITSFELGFGGHKGRERRGERGRRPRDRPRHSAVLRGSYGPTARQSRHCRGSDANRRGRLPGAERGPPALRDAGRLGRALHFGGSQPGADVSRLTDDRERPRISLSLAAS